jgi:hypothetical protein
LRQQRLSHDYWIEEKHASLAEFRNEPKILPTLSQHVYDVFTPFPKIFLRKSPYFVAGYYTNNGWFGVRYGFWTDEEKLYRTRHSRVRYNFSSSVKKTYWTTQPSINCYIMPKNALYSMFVAHFG